MSYRGPFARPLTSTPTFNIAQISCGTEWSGVQHEIEAAAQSVGCEVLFPEADVDDVRRAEEVLGYSPASHSLKVMMAQALHLAETKNVLDGVMVLTCFRCAEGNLVKHVVKGYLQRKMNIPVMVYSFTESTKAENMLLRMEALGSIIGRKRLLAVREHKGLTLGVDSGSAATKAVVMQDGSIIGSCWLPTTDTVASGEQAAEKALKDASLKLGQMDAVGLTGYGRFILAEKLKAKLVQEEITVCAKGATYLAKKMDGNATVVDIGGSDNKAMGTRNGVPDSFTVGGICAGASGRFLEVAARRIGVDVGDLGDLAAKGDQSKVPMNAYCIVFGIQDITAALAAGASREDVAAAACYSVAQQFFEQQLQEIDIREPVIEVGTTALNRGLVNAMESVMKMKVLVPPYPQYAGAVGAALLASGHVQLGG